MADSQRRFDLVEVSALVLFVAGIAAMAAFLAGQRNILLSLAIANPSGFVAEVATYEQRYGKTHYSIGVEEWMVRDFFGDRSGGVFVDVGAAEPINGSNTYYLEHHLGWSGLAIDARAELADAYRLARPRSRFAAFFVADRTDARVSFQVLTERPLSSSGDVVFAKQWAGGGPIETREVQAVTLNNLLPQAGIREGFDFISMDIELAEPKALAGFDLTRYRPRLVCIEAHPRVRQEILDYFMARQYRLVGKYLRLDVNNLWFVPAAELRPGY